MTLESTKFFLLQERRGRGASQGLFSRVFGALDTALDPNQPPFRILLQVPSDLCSESGFHATVMWTHTLGISDQVPDSDIYNVIALAHSQSLIEDDMARLTTELTATLGRGTVTWGSEG